MNYIQLFIGQITGMVNSINADRASYRTREQLVTQTATVQDWSAYIALAIAMGIVLFLITMKKVFIH